MSNPSLSELAMMADAYKSLRDKRLAMQKEVDAVKEQEMGLRAELLGALVTTEGLTGVVGKLCTVRHKTKIVPRATDWQDIYTYVKEHDAFELLQRSLTPSAVKERWDNGETIPGIEPMELDDLSVTKV